MSDLVENTEDRGFLAPRAISKVPVPLNRSRVQAIVYDCAIISFVIRLRVQIM